jgi:hypothetical protein
MDILRVYVTEDSKVSKMAPWNFPIGPPYAHGAKKLGRNRKDGVVRVKIDAQHTKAQRLHLQPIFKLTCVLSRLEIGVNRSLTLRLNEHYAQSIKVSYRGRTSHA